MVKAIIEATYDQHLLVSFKMQRYKFCFIFLSILLFAHAEWLKMYEEEEHRPTYYNRAHSAAEHVDYSRSKMAARDSVTSMPTTKPPPFDPQKDLSFYVNILYKNSVICAGSLISRRMVITSSRCFMGTETKPVRQYKARDMTVMTGNYFANPYAKATRVIAFFQPSSKENGTAVHDISLLGLEHKLDKANHRYIQLHRRKPKPNTQVLMTFIYPATQDITFYNSTVIGFERCERLYQDAGLYVNPDKEFFCVKNRRTSGCSTRPGDPVIIDNKLAGVNLYGEHCDELEGSRNADIYYAIEHTIKFIQTATDLLRGFTGTGPFNGSRTTKRTKLHEDTTTVKIETVVTDPEAESEAE